MVGRNDPCPCGSGKKYKKCCAGKSEVSMEKLVDEELERILLGIYELAPEGRNVAEFDRYLRQWGNQLGTFWDDENIEVAVSEYFLFVARPDLWKRYLLRALNTTVRSATRSIVEMWQTPAVLFGQIKGVHNGFIEVEEVLGNEKYCIEEEEGMSVEQGQLVFGVILPDPRNHPNGVYIVTSLLFIQDENEAYKNEVITLAKSSGFEKSADFYKEHMLDIYKIILDEDNIAVERIIEQQLTGVQQKVITILEDGLEKIGADPMERELLKSVGVTYLLMMQPNFRKPNVISAALLLTAIDLGMVRFFMTNVEIAKLFDVSTSSMTKHADNLHEFVFEQVDRMNEEMDEMGPLIAISVGTDPRITERPNWEMAVRMSRANFETLEEAQEGFNRMANEQFQPKGNKEQAQVFAYDAYDVENDRDRYRLAEKVLRLDPRNVDGLLLKAEIAETNEDIERLYQMAIQFGKIEFEEAEENPWGLVTNRPYMRALLKYGVWLLDEKRFEQAGSIFIDLLELNPNDHQSARYLAVSAFIQNEDYERADDILDDYSIGSDSDAVYLYLEWFLEACRTEGESEDLGWMFEEAAEENPFVGEMLDSNGPQPHYPRRSDFTRGSIEEARYIWSLLD